MMGLVATQAIVRFSNTLSYYRFHILFSLIQVFFYSSNGDRMILFAGYCLQGLAEPSARFQKQKTLLWKNVKYKNN